MKRVIAFLLAVVMTLSMMPVAALNILAAEDPNNDRALLGYAAKAIAGQPVVEDLNNNSFYRGQYGITAEEFCSVGTVKIDWDPEAFAKLNVTDGDMDDWAAAGYNLTMVDASNMVSWLGDVSDEWSTLAFFVADFDNLYFGFYITDPEFAYGSGGNYDGDAIQLSLDFGRKIGDQLDEDPAAVSNPKNIFYSFSCFADGEPLRIMRQESDQDGWLTEADGVVGSASRTENGWCAEFSMSWDRLYEDYEWKAWDEASRIYVGGEEELPLKIGCNLIYIDRSETAGAIHWAACTTNGITYEDGTPAVSWTAYDNGIQLELDYVEGMWLNCDGIVVLDGHTPETEPDPANPSNNTNSFISDVQTNYVGDSLRDSDLSNFFTVELPMGYGSTVVLADGAQKYELGGISDMFADVNGKYFIRFKDTHFNSAGWMFVRGYKVMNSDEVIERFNSAEGIFKINNYYETDGAGHMGGAGIYAQLHDGMLNIVLKYYDPNVVTRVGNAYYSIPCGGSELMIADDGKLVSIIVDGTTYATVELSGSVVYADINEVSPRNGFAETAVLRLTTGEAYEIQNTLIACSCENQVGIVVRPGNSQFSAVQVGGYSEVAVARLGQTAVTPWPDVPDPDDPDPDPDIPAIGNYNVPQNKWVITGHSPQIVYKEGMSLSAMVAAAGVDSAALLHQGSIGLGEIDLSKYSKVIIYCGTDSSQGTQDRYDQNAHNRIILSKVDTNMVMSPAEADIIAATTYTLPGWVPVAVVIDLSDVDYNGPVYVTWDTLPGLFMLISSIEFVADDTASDDLVSPEEAGVIAGSVDSFFVNGSLYFPQDGYASSKLDAIGNTITFTTDMVHETMTLRGWIGFTQPITSFGYVLDGEIVFGDFEQPTENGVKLAGGEHALRYAITVPLGHLSDGSHTVAFVILLEDGTLVLLRNPLTVVIGETSDEPDDPDDPEPDPDIPAIGNYNVPMDQWVITGHRPFITYAYDGAGGPMVQAAGLDRAALLHQGSIGLGEIDLSLYSKVIVTYTTDASEYTQSHYENNPQNRFLLLNADSSMVSSPAQSKIVAETTYSLPWSGWQLTTMEIDLTNVDYNGPVYLSWDTLPGLFMLISSIEFVADDTASDDLVSPEEAGVIAGSVDSFFVNGSLYFPQDGYASSKLDAIGNTITFTTDMVHETMTLRGWIGFTQPITSFGYILDGEIVFGYFEQPTEDGVKWAGGEHALRYAITVPLSHLSDGSHTVAFVILLEDGTLVLLRNPLTVVIGETPDEPDEPDANEIHVTTTDTYGYFDLFSFTAPVSGTYTFNLPTGLGVWDAVKYDTDLSSCPDVDFYDNTDGVSCSIYLVAGETWSFYVGAMIRQDWIITWTVEEDGPGYVDPDPDASYPLWSDHYNVVVHLSFDELYMGMEYPNYDGSTNIFTPGQAASWNGVAYVPDLSVTTLTSLGWVAVRGEVGRFGYQIDNSPFVFDDSFTRATEQIVIDVSQSAGGDTGSRFKIVIDVAGLVGRHTVRTVYQNPAGEIVVLREFTLMMGASEPGEGMWTTHQGINNYPSEDDDPDTVYPPESGYEYTSDGFTVIQPDWTDCIPFVTVSTKEAQSIKNGIYLKFRVDDYSYDGGYHADQWIGLSLNTGYENTGMLQPGSVEYGGGWLTLLRGNGNGLTTGILHLTDPMTEDFGGSFTGVGVSSIPVEVDDQGREIYTLEITWNGYEYEIKINGVMQSNAAQITALLERLSPSGEFFVGVTMHTAVRGGSAGLTILEYGTSEAMAIKPLGIDRKEPGENDVAIVPIIDPDTVPENTPAILWDPSTYDLQYGNNIHFTPNDDNTWKAIATDSSVFFQLSTKRKWSYAAENFPVFGIMVRNLWAESGALWYAAGEFFTATGGNVIPFSIYDGEFYGANEEYIFVPIDLTDLWEGRINSIRLDLFFEHQDRREFDLCFVGMFRSEEEAYTYAQAYLAEQGVGCDHEYEILVTPPTCTDIGFTTYMCSCGDVYRDDIVPPLGHSYVTYMIREATCTESGIRHSECSRCGTVLENIYIPATGHSYVTYMIREATCTEPGIMEHTCEDCGDTYPTYVYSEHRYVLNVHVDATCEADGKNTYTCDRCGDSYDEIIPGAHSYTAEITKIATEEEEGIITYTCSICGHSYTDIIPVRSSASVLLIQDRMPWDHNDNVLLLNHLKDAGYILGWDMVTTSTFHAADLAGYSVVMIANDQTTGAYDRLAALHDALTSYVRAGGVVIYGACDSGWAGGDIRSPLPGGVVKENFYSRYNYIADRLHPIVTGAMTDQKALTDALLYGNYCSHTYFHSDTIPADANIILRDAYGNPTLVEYAIGDGHVIASGLTWEFYYNRNAYEGGSLTYSKSVFDDLVVYAIGLSDPCEHIFDMGTVYGPTCTEDGYTLHTCLNCGLQMKDTFLPALGHTLGEWTVAYPATTEVNGMKQRCCTLCGAVLAEEIIPMLNAPIIQVQAPTDTVILGQEITFSVVIENCRPVKSLAVVPIFDTSVFELVDLRWTISALMQNIEPDTLRAVSVWSGSTDINTTVFTITLKAIATADSTAMDFTVILHDENGTVPAAVVAKNVSVIECPHEHMTCTEVDGDYHIGVCDLCGHSRVMSHRYESVCHTTCVDCGHERVAPHVPSPEWNGNGDMHWHDCELCGVHLGAAPHAYDNAYDAACNECGHSRFVNGDMDHDADVDSDDAVYLLYAILFGTAAYPVEQPLDLNRDGEANEDDALYLLYHSFFGESEYPLQSA